MRYLCRCSCCRAQEIEDFERWQEKVREQDTYLVPFWEKGAFIDKPDGIYRVYIRRVLGIYQSEVRDRAVIPDFHRMRGPWWWCNIFAEEHDEWGMGVYYLQLIRVKDQQVVQTRTLSYWITQ